VSSKFSFNPLYGKNSPLNDIFVFFEFVTISIDMSMLKQ
jgi:hypothetical protein